MKYNPIPKKAADPKATYLVRPEKKCQLTARVAHNRTILNKDKWYSPKKYGAIAKSMRIMEAGRILLKLSVLNFSMITALIIL
ncbi:MAG: hypothetical protein QXY34_04610 [Candidatus Bathyarchaeia archaeon]